MKKDISGFENYVKPIPKSTGTFQNNLWFEFIRVFQTISHRFVAQLFLYNSSNFPVYFELISE